MLPQARLDLKKQNTRPAERPSLISVTREDLLPTMTFALIYDREGKQAVAV